MPFNFRFLEKTNPVRYVSYLANNLQYYAAEDAVSADHLFSAIRCAIDS